MPLRCTDEHESTSCIADNANILSRDTETYITNISVALQENCSGAQIGVYTTDYVGNNTMEGYAYEVPLPQTWASPSE